MEILCLCCPKKGKTIALILVVALSCSTNAFYGSYVSRGLQPKRSFSSSSDDWRGRFTNRFNSRSGEEQRINIENSREGTVGSNTNVAIDDGSWSRKANGKQQRVGVRSRVRSVLAKAKNRTKIVLSSAAFSIADAASIGAFEDEETKSPVSQDASVFQSVVKPANGATYKTSKNGSTAITSDTITALNDAFGGDMNAAFSIPADPLPFERPALTRDQEEKLRNGERIQYQRDMGNQGYGYVVVDVNAPPDVVWDCLLDFHSYPQLIPTVRDIRMYTNTHLERDYRAEKPIDYEDGTVATLKHGVPSVTRAAFTLSKFRLNIAAIHKYTPHPEGDHMIFTLDPACTNFVLQFAKGVWHTQEDPYGDQSGYTRVWLLCELRVSKLLPTWITDYAAKRAMPRATTWLKPQVEAAAKLWLKKKSSPNGQELIKDQPQQ